MTTLPEQEIPVAIHPLGPTPGIVPVLPSVIPRTEHCEIAVHIGLFFDGTGNNKDWDDGDACHDGSETQLQRRKESNVARLFFAYPDDPDGGYFPVYVSGVGTPFKPIGEDVPAMTGMAFGGGGDGRINFGLLSVFNSIHRAASSDALLAYGADVVMALCRNGIRTYNPRTDTRSSLVGGAADESALETVSMRTTGGLLMDALTGSRQHAKAFYKREAQRIAAMISSPDKSRPVEIFIDAFGFSRGAAEARVFCNWLNELFEGDMLCGVRATIRFLGLFDTVASVGLANSSSMTYDLTNGHAGWGSEQYLRIPGRIKNCVHFVAMHENRPSFPLDRVLVNNGLPDNCHEYAFPGMHSDVGGGYEVNEQGRGRLPISSSKNLLSSEKLSQLPLEYMLKAAQAAKVPLNPERVRQADDVDVGYKPFQVDDGLRQAYARFHAACSPSARQPADWLIVYLAWRYQVRDTYTQLPWASRVHSLSKRDMDDLAGANQTLLSDIAALDTGLLERAGSASYEAGKAIVQTFERGNPLLADLHRRALPESTVSKLRKLAPEADDVLRRLRSHPTVSEAEADLFSTYAHDSYAGFRPYDHQFRLWLVGCRKLLPGSWEPEGYLRYRRFYTGFAKARTYKVVIADTQLQRIEMQNLIDSKGYGIGDAFSGRAL
ncbi:DUF2235 domain-containing protein [Paraburkholderia sp. SARCC-3016]|uniref:T6SS phospholipase effector Tle1-like catalytic domain-containing protein n=1 Tax=Paraburkholderia sp. SARCC-3016 TaxID=3058611 RepID=UPI002807B7EA|nr:DUF2235 domain-containing protein [Paraburkholderia sp. SARCC-3016]MDQ7977252.1 DUF2235 domain-containing protein [Paraburkholderia sp. SARCC-3016]